MVTGGDRLCIGIDGFVLDLGVLAIEFLSQAPGFGGVKDFGAFTGATIDFGFPFNNALITHEDCYSPDLGGMKWVETRFGGGLGQ
jgi:hypothetical protein